jgi:mannose-6-phosphate isomerase-like protein (cupin superfamily)
VYVRDPDAAVELRPGETYVVPAGRPHLVTNAGDASATFLVLQGIGTYDYVPLAPTTRS